MTPLLGDQFHIWYPFNRKAQKTSQTYLKLQKKIYFVEVGKYGGLEKILREFDQNYVQIIERSEDEIRAIKKSDNNPRPFQGIKSIIK